jgi:hypothetical protein
MKSEQKRSAYATTDIRVKHCCKNIFFHDSSLFLYKIQWNQPRQTMEWRDFTLPRMNIQSYLKWVVMVCCMVFCWKSELDGYVNKHNAGILA